MPPIQFANGSEFVYQTPQWICSSLNIFRSFYILVLLSPMGKERESEWNLQNHLACSSLQLHMDWISVLTLAFLKLPEVSYNLFIRCISELMYRHLLLPTHPFN